MFPWLSQVAQRFESYKFRNITFKYHTRAATTQVGTVGLAFDFDALDPAPDSQLKALSYHDKEADATWKEMRLTLDLSQGDKFPSRYTRIGTALTATSDLKTYDLGNLHVFTDGVAASSNLGLLEVCYSIDLFVPQIEGSIGGYLADTAGLDATHLFGTNPGADAQSFFPGILTASDTFTFNQVFEGLLILNLTGTVLVDNTLTPTISAGGTAQAVGWLTLASQLRSWYIIRVKAIPGVTFSPTVTATTVTASYWYFAGGPYNSYGA
jgi:hypothetical protein